MATVDSRLRTAPNGLRVVSGELACIAVLGAVLAVAIPTSADPDLWGHVRFGQVALAAGELPDADPFSFTNDRAWINHEWLAEVAMAAAFQAQGGAGLVALKALLVILAMGLAAWTLRPPGASGRWSLLALLFVGLAGVFPLTVTFRPQVFSILFFVAEFVVLVTALSRPVVLWALPPLFLVWANIHGGWLVGGAVLGVWAAMRAADRDATGIERRVLAAVAAASIVATLATPYGVDLWGFLRDTIGMTRADIPEWGPLVDHPELIVPWLLTCAVATTAAAHAGRVGRPALAVALVLAALSANVGRLVPFFSLAVGLGLVPLALRPPVPCRSPRHTLLRYVALVVAGATLAVGLTLAQRRALACIPPAPTLVLDPAAGAFLAANRLQGRLAVWFDWGQYAIWHFGPRLKVSIDGRRETVYSARVLERHLALYAGAGVARAYLDELSPDYVWLPRALPVATSLDGWGYRRIFESQHSVVWTTAADPRSYAASRMPAAACFPGP